MNSDIHNKHSVNPDVKSNSIDDMDSLSDEEFHALAEEAPAMLWCTNKEGKHIFSNKKWKRFVGEERVLEKGGQAWFEALHPDDRERCLVGFEDAFGKHKPFQMEYRLLRRDGEYRHVLDVGEPFISKEGQFVGFIGTSIDITERKRSEEKLRRSHMEMAQRNHEMSLINELNSYLQVCHDIEETYPIIANYTGKIFPDCAGSLYLFNESKDAVEMITSWGKEIIPFLPMISPQDCWALRQGKLHTVDDSDGALLCKHLPECPEYGYTCVPITAQNDMVGFLHLQYTRAIQDLDDETLEKTIEARSRIINVTADNLALALVNLKLSEMLKEQSIRDPLTQLYNRRFMEDSLERELSRCDRSGDALCVIMLDIDFFKQYNDKYGHDAGDLVLVEVAKFIKHTLRSSDITCRYGGEEFILIMPSISEEVAHVRAEDIRTGIQHLKITYQGNLLGSITVSLGLSLYPRHGKTADILVKAADMALYEAKEKGRDRVEVATPIDDLEIKSNGDAQ